MTHDKISRWPAIINCLTFLNATWQHGVRDLNKPSLMFSLLTKSGNGRLLRNFNYSYCHCPLYYVFFYLLPILMERNIAFTNKFKPIIKWTLVNVFLLYPMNQKKLDSQVKFGGWEVLISSTIKNDNQTWLTQEITLNS